MANGKVDTSTFRKKMIAYRMRILAIVVATIVAILVIFFVARRSYILREYTSYTVVDSVERINVESSRVLGFGTQFITYSADGIHCTDRKGKDVWSYAFEMQNPMVEINGDYVACCDYNGQNIYIFGATGMLGTIQTNSPVKNICISATGVVAVIIDNGSVTPINLFYYDGTQIASFRTTMSKSGYPVAIGISDDSKLVGVSYLYLDSGKLVTKVAYYNFGGVGQNETDNLVSGYDYQDEIVPVIKFLSDDVAFALGSNRLLFYEGKERPVNSANILLSEQVKAVYYGDNRVGLVYNDATGENRYRLDVYNSEGELENTFKFDLEYSNIFFANDKVVIYNAGSALIYSDRGILKFSGSFEESVSLILPTEQDTKYVLITPTSIETIVLQ